ncbi:MAG: type IV pilus twitching motility protein PilT, partial [Armatimonadota bacterium]
GLFLPVPAAGRTPAQVTTRRTDGPTIARASPKEAGSLVDWETVVQAGVDQKASDVFFKVGSPPHMRVNGYITPTDLPPLSEDDTRAIAHELMTDRQIALFEDYHERDIGLTFRDQCRLRINIYQERGNIGLVMRIIPIQVLTLQELGLPEVLGSPSVALARQGLILVTGPTGCGKSTSLAAMIDLINTTRHCNIVTIEDPIEYVHRDKNSIVNQREVGVDTESFTDALKYVVRQSPDVILIGEMRDPETMNVAMQAAETGHLVFSTVHTVSAAETMERIINMFPPHDKPQICLRMSKTLNAVISQKLVPRCDVPGRACACEIMICTPTIAKFIEDGHPSEVYSAIDEGAFWGMQTMNQALAKLFMEGKVSEEEAMHNAGNRTELKQMLRRARQGISAEESGRGQRVLPTDEEVAVAGPATQQAPAYDPATYQQAPEQDPYAAQQPGQPQAPQTPTAYDRGSQQ